MINKTHSKIKRLFPIALVVAGIAMLASCSSSNQFASSFSKRKYTTGHFSDPVAKAKTEVKPGSNNSVALNTTVSDNSIVNDAPIAANKKTETKPKFTADVNSNNIIGRGHSNQVSSTSNKAVASIAKTPVNYQKNNVSLSQASTVLDSPANDHGNGGGGGGLGGHHWLRLFFLMILLGFVLLILGVLALSPFILILSYFCFLAACVFFILWIISLAS